MTSWLGCHQRAFRFFGGVPRRAIIDNPKCAITKACSRDPEVQRAYGELAEAYEFKIDLLVLDDYGLKPLKPPQDEDLHDLIAERYERHPTVVTSNLDFAEWGDAFTNRLLGAATLDRLRHGAYRVVLEGESYRRPRPLGRFQMADQETSK